MTLRGRKCRGARGMLMSCGCARWVRGIGNSHFGGVAVAFVRYEWVARAGYFHARLSRVSFGGGWGDYPIVMHWDDGGLVLSFRSILFCGVFLATFCAILFVHVVSLENKFSLQFLRSLLYFDVIAINLLRLRPRLLPRKCMMMTRRRHSPMCSVVSYIKLRRKRFS